MTTVIGSSESGMARSSLADTSTVQERNLFCCSVPPMTKVSPAKTVPGKNRKQTTIRHSAHIQDENCCRQFTEDLLAMTSRARRKIPALGWRHMARLGAAVAHGREVLLEPCAPSMEWSCDVRETRLPR